MKNKKSILNNDIKKYIKNYINVPMYVLAILILISNLLIISCDNKYESKNPDDIETINSGKLDIMIDSELNPMMDTTLEMYKSFYPNVRLTSSYSNSREVMANLFNGKRRAVIIAREYLKDEDSLLIAYKIEKHLKMKIANDALVFFVNNNSQYDTLSKSNFEDYFVNSKRNFLQASGIDVTPEFYVVENNSSTFQNFKSITLNNQKNVRRLNYEKNIEEIKTKVLSNDNFIGMGYLSQLADDPRFKLLKIGYLDTNNVYIRPKIVHQSNLLRGYYPYKVPIYVYLLENRQNLPFWFSSFLAKETKVQKYFLDKGIVPTFASIKLKFDE